MEYFNNKDYDIKEAGFYQDDEKVGLWKYFGCENLTQHKHVEGLPLQGYCVIAYNFDNVYFRHYDLIPEAYTHYNKFIECYGD